MSLMGKISSLFKKKPENELQKLNNTCNRHFEVVFESCRLELGRELVGIMDMKKRLVESINSCDGCTPVQEMLAKKFLELVDMYFGLAHSYISIKKGVGRDEAAKLHIEGLKDKQDRILVLAGSLNTQFYIKAEPGNQVSMYNELLNEAEALCNVLRNEGKSIYE